MTENKKQTTSKTISYDVIKKLFLEEAGSLIPDTVMEQTLAEEKLRFENATLLRISPLSIIGNNTSRHCKDLLRKKQPLSFIYTFLCFLSEVSILMLLYGIAMGIGKALFTESGFLSSFTCLYELILFSGVISGITVFRKHLNDTLALPFSTKRPSDAEIQERKKLLKHKRMLSVFVIFLIMAVAAGLVAYFKLQSRCTINVTICFFAYIICMLLSGIHNVIYNSHTIPFLTIGGFWLLGKSAEILETACNAYLNLSYLQILSLSHKTLDDSRNNPELMDKLKKTVHSRMITGRVYCILAMVILVILDIICFLQLRGTVTPAFVIFFAISLLLTAVFLVSIVSANYILKSTKSA